MQIFTSAVPKWSHSPTRLGGEGSKSGQEGLQGREGLQRLRGKGSPLWHIWNLGPPRRIRGIAVEPSLTKGKLNFQYLFLYRFPSNTSPLSILLELLYSTQSPQPSSFSLHHHNHPSPPALNRWASLPQRTRWASLPQRTTPKFLRTPTQLRRRKRAHSKTIPTITSSCEVPRTYCAYCLLPVVPIAYCLLPIVHVKYHVPIVPFAIISKWITVCVNFTSSFSQEVAKRGPLCMRRCLVSHHFFNNYNEGKNFDNT